ncbi:MAG: zf-HC2 domain-containing protein [Clostridia bacterium]|nr:zf-HC2 domain-containing protein [Clostridia bacterium]
MSKLCDAIREDLSAYIDGVLNENEAKCVEKHLAECEKCREEHRFLSGILQSATTMPSIPVSNRFREELHSKLVAEASKPKAIKIRKRPIWQMASGFVAAVAVIAISVVSFSSLPKQSELTPFVPTPSVNQLETSESMHTPAPTQVPEENTKQKSTHEQNIPQTVESPLPEEKKESVVPEESISMDAAEPQPIPAEEAMPVEPVTIANATADMAVSGGGSGGGMARAAMPFMKTGMCYSIGEESFSIALNLLSVYEMEGEGYLVPDEDLFSLCENLEALKGYKGHENIAESLNEPTDEQVALYSTHTLVVVEKSE